MSRQFNAEQTRAIGTAISRIYHHTQGETTSEFAFHALAQMAELTGADSARWQIFHKGSDELAVCYHWPEERPHIAMLRENSAKDTIRHYQPDHRNNPYLDDLNQFGVRDQWVLYRHHDKVSHCIILNFVSLPKGNTRRDLLGFMAPNAIRAFHHCLQAKLARQGRHWHSQKAIYTQQGTLVEAQSGFTSMLTNGLQDWQTDTLPVHLDLTDLPYKHITDELGIELTAAEDWIVAEVYHADAQIEKLSKTERRIAERLLKGNTTKEIAAILQSEVKTIDNHLQTCSESSKSKAAPKPSTNSIARIIASIPHMTQPQLETDQCPPCCAFGGRKINDPAVRVVMNILAGRHLHLHTAQYHLLQFTMRILAFFSRFIPGIRHHQLQPFNPRIGIQFKHPLLHRRHLGDLSCAGAPFDQQGTNMLTLFVEHIKPILAVNGSLQAQPDTIAIFEHMGG